jgi:hypothetical protein
MPAMRRLPSSYDGSLPFGDLLRWHLLIWGTRPTGSTEASGERWVKEKFAAVIGSDPKTLERYFHQKSLPSSPIFIRRALFGGNKEYSTWAADLNAQLEEARRAKKVLKQPVKASTQAAGRSPEAGPFDARPALAGFTGRQRELDRLHEVLGGGTAAVITQLPGRASIYGMGGIGKTTIALEYSHRFRDAYQGVWWCRAESRATLVADLARLAVQIGVVTGEHADFEDAAASAVRAVAAEREPWLLIFDNAQDPSVISDFIPSTRARVLITSRYPDWSHTASEIQLDVLSLHEATHLLQSRAGRTDDPIGARDLADALGCLPLALDHAGALCRIDLLSFREYLDSLKQRLADAPTDARASPYPPKRRGYVHPCT